MLDGLAYGLFAAVMWGFTDVCAALAARRLGGLTTVAAVQAVSLLGLYAVALVGPAGFAIDPSVAPRALVLGLASAIGYIAFFTALGLGPVAVVSPVASAYGGLAVVLAVVVLGERLTSTQAVGAALGTIGILLVAVRIGGGLRATRFVGPGVPLAILSFVIWGSVTIGLTTVLRESQMGLISVLLVARTANTVVVWALLGARRVARRGGPRLPAKVPYGILGIAAVGGILDVTGYLVYAEGLRRSLAWLVGLSSSFGPAVVIIVAVLFMGERLRRVQWLGLGALAVGVVLVGFR